MNPLKLHTEVEVSPLERRFGSDARLFAIGSCFAAEIGERLGQSGFDITLNPFGTLYNPASIAAAVQRLKTCTLFTENEVIFSEPLGRYNSFWHHTKFSSHTVEGFLSGANAALQSVKYRHLHLSSLLFCPQICADYHGTNDGGLRPPNPLLLQ